MSKAIFTISMDENGRENVRVNTQNMRRMLLKFGVPLGEGEWGECYYAFDGKAYCDKSPDTIYVLGDYFEFMRQVRAGRFTLH